MELLHFGLIMWVISSLVIAIVFFSVWKLFDVCKELYLRTFHPWHLTKQFIKER
jgi:hypothetical protein